MRWCIAFLFSAAAVVLMANVAAAHVLITDESRSKGAIVHIVPDDDPIAGERAIIYLDIQSVVVKEDASASMRVVSTDGVEQTVAMKAEVGLFTAPFVFPTQGVYELTFDVSLGNGVYTFLLSQRVSRGVMGSALDTQEHTWAESLLVGAGIGVAMVGIFVFNRRKAIAKQSTF